MHPKGKTTTTMLPQAGETLSREEAPAHVRGMVAIVLLIMVMSGISQANLFMEAELRFIPKKTHTVRRGPCLILPPPSPTGLLLSPLLLLSDDGCGGPPFPRPADGRAFHPPAPPDNNVKHYPGRHNTSASDAIPPSPTHADAAA